MRSDNHVFHRTKMNCWENTIRLNGNIEATYKSCFITREKKLQQRQIRFLTQFEFSCENAALPPAHHWTCGPGRGNESSSSEMVKYRELKAANIQTEKKTRNKKCNNFKSVTDMQITVHMYPHSEGEIWNLWLVLHFPQFMYFTLQLLRSWLSFMPWRPSQKQRKLPRVFRHSSAHTLVSHSSTSDRWQRRFTRQKQRRDGSREFQRIRVPLSGQERKIRNHWFHNQEKKIRGNFLSTNQGMKTTLESSSLWRWLCGFSRLHIQP